MLEYVHFKREYSLKLIKRDCRQFIDLNDLAKFFEVFFYL